MMKYTPTHHYLTLSLILIISTSISIATGQSYPVFDRSGNEVEQGEKYTLVASNTYGNILHGGLSPDTTCPPNVVQNTSDDTIGLPLVVFRSRNGVIRTSSSLSIEFASLTTCGGASYKLWELQYNSSLKKFEIKLGSRTGFRNYYFKLEEVMQFHYRLLYCPSVCIPVLLLRDDLPSSRRRLVASASLTQQDEPFFVTITRAQEDLMIPNLPPSLSNPTS